MIDLIYKVLKARLKLKSPDLKKIDWYLAQPEDDNREGLLFTTPAAFIEFTPFDWKDVSNNAQGADTSFIIHDVGSSVESGEKRLIGSTDHLAFAKKTYVAFKGFSANLSDVVGLEHLKGTDLDSKLINTVTRTRTFTDQALTRFTRTMQEFSTRVYDYSATPQLVEVLAELEEQLEIKK